MTEKLPKASISQWNSYFDIGDSTIRICGSNLSGGESVFINDELVSKKYNWTFKSSHQVYFEGKHYKITVELLSVIRPQIRIRVLHDGVLVDEDFIFPKDGKDMSTKTQIARGLSAALLAGVVTYILVKMLSTWLMGG